MDVSFVFRMLKGRWNLPGGRINCPEPLVEALRREIREELCVEITSIDADHPWVWDWQPASTSRPSIQNIVGIGWPCTLASRMFRHDPEEHVAHQWVTSSELQALNMHDGHRAGYLRWMRLQNRP